jgi:aminoglycoside/choline kinase family phosphotransferase
VLSDLERLSQDAPGYFRKLAALPQSLCHLDPGRFNIRVRKDASGRNETVFLDWQMLAVGPLGTDLAMMNVLNLYRLYVSPDDAERYSEVTLNAYLGGLRKVGVTGNLDEVRFAYRAAASLRAGAIVRVIIHHLTEIGYDQTQLSEWGKRQGWNRDETLRAWGCTMRVLMALAS